MTDKIVLVQLSGHPGELSRVEPTWGRVSEVAAKLRAEGVTQGELTAAGADSNVEESVKAAQAGTGNGEANIWSTEDGAQDGPFRAVEFVAGAAGGLVLAAAVGALWWRGRQKGRMAVRRPESGASAPVGLGGTGARGHTRSEAMSA